MIWCTPFCVAALILPFCHGSSSDSLMLSRKKYSLKNHSPDGVILSKDFMEFVAKYFLSENDEIELLTLDHKENISFIRLLYKDKVSNDTDDEVTFTIHDIGEKLRISHGACKIDKINININEEEPESKKFLQIKKTRTVFTNISRCHCRHCHF